MKANEAPEKIYLDEDETWHLTNPNGDSVEYFKTDAFIEKACSWLKVFGGSYWMDDYDLPTDELVNDFRKYMEGEQRV